MTTGAAAHLQLLRAADDVQESSEPDPSLTSVEGIAPDDGSRAHPATTGERTVRSRQDVENELVGFVCDLVQAPDTAIGNVSAGVFEAATLVIHGARQARPHVRRPTMVISAGAHPAYAAAATALGVVPLIVPVGSDGRAPIGPMTAAITDDTVLLIASAPSYTHGVVDPVAWLAAVATAKGVPLHVDAAAGGWTLAFAERDGRLGPMWGFAVAGVDSLTLDAGPDNGEAADLSVTVHRTPSSRALTHVLNPLANAARAWQPETGRLAEVGETVREVGADGCAELALRSLDAVAELVDGISEISGVAIVARPDAASFTVRAGVGCDVFTIADELLSRGWASEPLLSSHGRPALLRFHGTAALQPVVEQCVAAFVASVEAAQERGSATLDPILAATLTRFRPDGDSRALTGMLEAAASLDARMPTGPDSTLMTNLLLDAADRWTRQALAATRHDLQARPVRQSAIATTDASV